jgi:hypothetical protein
LGISPKTDVDSISMPETTAKGEREMTRILLSVVAIILPLQVCLAGLDDPIVWIVEGISLKGHTQVVLNPVTNDTGETFEFDVTKTMTDALTSELVEAGLEILKPEEAQGKKDVVKLNNSLVFYTGGGVGGRWLGFGGGAAVCILRTYLIEPDTEDILGEIIVARQVSGGGLFSAGAEKSVPKHTAEELVEQLVSIVRPEA